MYFADVSCWGSALCVSLNEWPLQGCFECRSSSYCMVKGLCHTHGPPVSNNKALQPPPLAASESKRMLCFDVAGYRGSGGRLVRLCPLSWKLSERSPAPDHSHLTFFVPPWVGLRMGRGEGGGVGIWGTTGGGTSDASTHCSVRYEKTQSKVCLFCILAVWK